MPKNNPSHYEFTRKIIIPYPLCILSFKLASSRLQNISICHIVHSIKINNCKERRQSNCSATGVAQEETNKQNDIKIS